jgi:hypothetical protein
MGSVSNGDSDRTLAVRDGKDADSGQTSHAEKGSLRSTVLMGLAALGLLAPVAATFWLISQYSVNMVWYDQWDDVQLLSYLYGGHLTAADLWAQHNENRVFFPNLLVLVLSATTHFNIAVEDYLSGVLLVAATALFVLAHRRASPSTPWIYYCPVAIVMLTFIQGANTLWGFQVAWYFVLIGLAVSLYLLDRPTLTWISFVGAIGAAVLGSFSSLQGLLIWIVGLLLLYHRRRSRLVMFAWIAAAIEAGTVYFAGFNVAAGGADTSYLFKHPAGALKFFFFAIGDVIGVQNPVPDVGTDVLVLLGIVLFGLSIWVIVNSVIRRSDPGGSVIGAALACFGLLFAVFVAEARASAGLGLASRYATFDLLIPVGCYLALLDRMRLRQWKRNSLFAVRALLVGIIGVQVVLSIGNGLEFARNWHATELLASDVTVNINKASDEFVKESLFPTTLPYIDIPIRTYASLAKRHRLSLFDTTAPAVYGEEGLPRYGIPPKVLMLKPSPGATLKGTRVLDAGVTDDYYQLERVQFHVTGGGVDETIGSATQTLFGWLARWNTATVPDGRYTLQSTAIDADGNRGYSSPVVVSVANGS